ncbi:MAG: DNA translocase FtsK 4TM domain-containing protein [Roseicyclus sp.]|nr:DNA translocase FtsK 4TM domain-containing protein [Roseicyclus sp.]MBO6624476.1 DNA translocase FtsK 4TM domain-containing protein [Roseicyclus sp.]MBO6920687.1 DNA translocase FtsK 4TM domain-containing protein [Roseicyclus sp.]
MAYQTRQRDPLLDSRMQAAIERRGKELLGLLLCVLGVALALMLASYTPEDPNWTVATDAVPQNILGHLGASLAAVLMLIVGYGAYGLAAGALVWGLRFLLHRGEDRVFGRIVFLPIAVALASIYAASYVPGAGWTHSFGLGGLFGDTVLGALLNILPFGAAFGLKLLAALSFLAAIGLGLFVLGVNGAELRVGLRFLIVGLISTIAGLAALFGQAGRGAGQAAQALQERRLSRIAARQDLADAYEDDIVERVEPVVRASAPRPSLLERVPLLRSRDRSPEPEPELLERPPIAGAEISAPDDDRIREKIADVIKNRVRRPLTAPQAAVARHQSAAAMRTVVPPLTRVEPPLTSADMRSPDAAEQTIELPYSERIAELQGEPSRAGGFAVPQAEPKKVVQHQTRRPAPSRAAMADAQPSLPLEAETAEYEFPPLSLLSSAVAVERYNLSDEALEENARMLENVLDDYGVKGEIVSVRPGPVVTMYELEPAPGLKASRVIGLADDIARSMSALSARVSTVPGRSVIGIELPNQHREKVVLREILSSRDFGDGNQSLPLALGKDIGGDPIVANLAKMPHLLIAGTTGSGKSVAINTMILSLLYKLTPEECRMIMIDPKMLELSVYDGIPHLLSPVVTDPKKAVVALKWTVGEMEERYRKMSKMGVRNIEGYNSRVEDALSKGEMFSRTVQTGFDDDTGEPVFETEEFAPEKMPFIVVIVDEMADLMMVAGKEIEACIQRLAQMARASGIHIIMATQRPSVDVITGTIKANFPTRISFHVTSKVDSRTILGEQGAEQLLGMGDMLYMAGGAKITRVHGPFVSDEEVEEIVCHLKSFGPPDYAASVLDGPDGDKESDIDLVLGLGGNTDGEDALYDQAVQIVITDRKCSTSYIQRKLAIGYNKAARLVEQMEESGLVSPANHVGKREILVPEQA